MSADHKGMPEWVKTIIIILAILFIYPLGVILTFVWTKWPLWVKIIVAIVPLILATILGFLAVGILVTINPAGQMAKARDAKRKSDIMLLSQSINIYVVERNTFPTMLDDLRPKYISTIPVDPTTNQPYRYTITNQFYAVCADMEITKTTLCAP